MREVLDRLREAESALDMQLSDLYFEEETQARDRALERLWRAKKSLWLAQMCVLDAAAGHQTPVPH